MIEVVADRDMQRLNLELLPAILTRILKEENLVYVVVQTLVKSIMQFC